MLGRFGIDPPGQPAPAWTTREVARLPRVAARSRPELWPQWCAHHGVHEADCRPTLEFDNTVPAIQATSLALGVMAPTRTLAYKMLRSQMGLRV